MTSQLAILGKNLDVIVEPTEEEVIGIWCRATYPKDLDQVMKLAMDVSDNGDGRCDMNDIALPH